MGAIPWVLLQILMVAIVIVWPGLISMFLDKEKAVDIDKVKIELERPDYGAPKDLDFLKGAPKEEEKPDPAKFFK
jgi:hypothetical protein